MNTDKFMVSLVSYYGNYANDVISSIVKKYIESLEKNGSNLEKMFYEIVKVYSNQFKTPPDVAKIIELTTDKYEVEKKALESWNEVNKKVNSYANVIISDGACQYAIENMGGWISFCQRDNDPAKEVWVKKRFMELYAIGYTENIEPKILKGIIYQGGGSKARTVHIGQSERCLQIEQDIKTKAIEENKVMQQINFKSGEVK